MRPLYVLFVLFAVTFSTVTADRKNSKRRSSRQHEDSEDDGTGQADDVICLQSRFYQAQTSLGCEAEYDAADTKKICPIRYKCPGLESPGRENRCHVDGKSFKPGDKVPSDNPCQDCFCGHPDARRNLPPAIECIGKECPDVGPLRNTRRHQCFYTFEKANSCCPKSKAVCVERNSTGECQYRDVQMYDGQKIFPSEDPCTVCQCNGKYAGINGKTCERIECNLKHHRQKLLKGCIPIYLQTACCPVDWICPKRAHKVPKDSDSSKCYFEGKEYEQNAVMNHQHPNKCVKCRCIAPTMFTCIQETCPPPPRPRQGYQCVPKEEEGECCPQFDCNVRIRDPCERTNCGRDDICIRLLDQNCRRAPCDDFAECVPAGYNPCDELRCRRNEVCVPHQFPCPARHCPVRAACLPADPCKDKETECGEGKVCRNVIAPCLVAPCPKTARCVNSDPCIGHKCLANHVCHAVPVPCSTEKCPKDPVCSSPDCPQVSCDRNSIYRPFGKGRDNCSWCEPIRRTRQPVGRRQPISQRDSVREHKDDHPVDDDRRKESSHDRTRS